MANTGRNVRRPSGFTLPPTGNAEEGKSKDSDATDRSKSCSLHEWVTARRPSNIKPEVHSTASWFLTQVPEEDRTVYKDYEGQFQQTQSDRDKDESNIKRERKGTKCSRSPSPTQGRSPKRARLQDQETACAVRGRSPTTRQNTNTEGSPSQQPLTHPRSHSVIEATSAVQPPPHTDASVAKQSAFTAGKLAPAATATRSAARAERRACCASGSCAQRVRGAGTCGARACMRGSGLRGMRSLWSRGGFCGGGGGRGDLPRCGRACMLDF